MEEKDLAGGEEEAVAKTPDKYKTMALWCMLPDSLRDGVDLKTGEHVGDYSTTRNFVMRFAEAKRKHRDDAMDTSPVNLEEQHGQEQWDPSWGSGWDEWGPADSERS